MPRFVLYRAAEKGGTLTLAYLDNSATTRVCEEAAQEILYTLTEGYGNPSSLHAKGFEAERLLGRARERVAGRIGCAPEEVLFTSGGTEANNLAIFGAAQSLARRGHRIVTTAIEHPSVEKPVKELERQGFEVVFLPAGEDWRSTAMGMARALPALMRSTWNGFSSRLRMQRRAGIIFLQ